MVNVPQPRFPNSKSGSSLIELLIAVSILSLALIMIVTVITKGRELQVSDKHYREARAIIESLMETKYDDRNYFFNTVGNTIDNTYSIDNTFLATLTKMIVANNVTITPNTSVTFPTKEITLSIQWAEADGKQNTLTLKKIITLIKEKL